nr:NADH dehydrogenase subunit 3 [Lissachatina fulica]WJZ52999.1 NADH dehydrogenase subunit 3 [Lissachatina fulica]
MMKYTISVLFILCVLFLPLIGSLTKWYPSQTQTCKMTAFECGFEPLGETRIPFSMRFFVLVVLFLIFDVEVALLLPILTKIINLSWSTNMCVTLMVFLMILLFGLAYEWKEGSLNWVTQ